MAETVTIGSTHFGGGQTRIAVPVMSEDPARIEDQWRAAVRAGADLVEWRIDAVGEPDLQVGRRLRSELGVPVLATVRTAQEGGHFAGTPDAYQELICGAAQWADAVDIEFAASDAESLLEAAQDKGAAVVFSHHVWGRPAALAEIQECLLAMAEAGADIAKVAWMASSTDEVEAVISAQIWAFDNLMVPAVVIAMGEEGTRTRLGDCAARSAFTFAVATRSSAPGQPTVTEVRESLNGAREVRKE